MDEGILSSSIALLVLLVCNGLLTVGYNALMNAPKPHLAALAEEGRPRAALALRISQDATILLITYQIAAILVRFVSAGIAAVGIAPPLARGLAGAGLAPAVAFVLAELIVLVPGAGVMLIAGGQIPAAIGAAYASKLAPISARPMHLLMILLRPMIGFQRWLADRVVSLLGVHDRAHYVTEEEIKTLVDAGQEEGVIESEEKEMIYSIFQFGDTSVREVMIPRLDMIAVRIDTPLDEAVHTVLEAGHSRIPVYEDNIDHIKGLLYAKDLLKLWGHGGNGDALKKLLRPAYFVPEGKNALDLLQEMQLKRVHLAVVVDEYGGTAGLVTLEDLIEEIIGEVQDEYDQNEPEPYRQISEDEVICSARLDLDDLNELLHIDLPTDETDTVGGFIYSQVGEVPTPGAVIEIGQVRLEVLSVDQRRIGQVRVTRLRPEAEPSEEPPVEDA